MNARPVILTVVGFAAGMGEALIYYNMGQAANGQRFRLAVPQRMELLKVAGVVLATSVITTLIFKGLEMALESATEPINESTAAKNDHRSEPENNSPDLS